jgi:hypothetical protein
MGEWLYRFTYSWPRHQLVSGQLHAPGRFTPGEVAYQIINDDINRCGVQKTHDAACQLATPTVVAPSKGRRLEFLQAQSCFDSRSAWNVWVGRRQDDIQCLCGCVGKEQLWLRMVYSDGKKCVFDYVTSYLTTLYHMNDHCLPPHSLLSVRYREFHYLVRSLNDIIMCKWPIRLHKITKILKQYNWVKVITVSP